MPTLTLNDVVEAVNGRQLSGSDAVSISGVSTDSRTMRAGELFVPLKGERFDGHDFVAAAVAQGAAAVLIQADRIEKVAAEFGADPPRRVAFVAVEDTLVALLQLAAWHRRQFCGPVVAVTGSNGKTTTKDMIAAVLAEKGPVLATAGNLNTEIGVSLTLLRREPQHEYIVVEMGMRGLGQIADLVSVARPTVGVVTNVGPVHLELLKTMEAVTAAKRELVEGLPAAGTAVLNADDPRVAGMASASAAEVITYGCRAAADVRGKDIRSLGEHGVAFTLWHGGQHVEVHLPIIGRHNVYNALAAAAVGLTCGLDLESIARGLAGFTASAMRMQLERLPTGITVLNDAYNASPASMRAALETLTDLPADRRIAVLGDMLELGHDSEAEHTAIGRLVAALPVDLLLTVGHHGGRIADGARSGGFPADCIVRVHDALEAADRVRALAQAGDVILVKASRGLQLEQVVNALKEQSTKSGEVL